MRYRLDVLTADVADVVTCAGGWLYDRVTAGWDVTVLVCGAQDARPLHVLGADVIDLETAIAMADRRAHPHTLAVGIDMFDADPRVRNGVLAALGHGAMQVTLWGETWPREVDCAVARVEHRLSAAAQAFKAQAVAAATGTLGRVEEVETFRSGTVNCLSVAADLMPAS